MKYSIVCMYFLMLLTAISPLFLYALILRQELVLVLGISEWIEIIVGVIFLESIWAGVLVFFIGERNKEKREKESKLSNHYRELRENVLEKWLVLSVQVLSNIKDFPRVISPSYLATWLDMDSGTFWHKCVLQHISDGKGYPDIQKIIQQVVNHEEEHNKFVASLLRTLDDEVESMLKAFPNLKEYEGEMVDNFYFRTNILSVLQVQDVSLQVFDGELYLGKSSKIAKANNETLLNLKDAIERIRIKHKKDFQKIKNGIEEDQRLLSSIRSHIEKIIYEIRCDEPLKGKCDYERSLDKIVA